MRAIIIDDERNNISNLQRIIREHCPSVEIVAAADNAATARELIVSHRPDLLFLDIQMPGKNGFELLQSIPQPDFEIIFVTAFDKYGIQAIRFSALDYLLKPVVIADLKTAVERAVRKVQEKRKNQQLDNLLNFLQQKNEINNHKIALPSAKETRFVRPGDIMYCEAKNNYTIFYLSGGEKLIISKPLFEYEELLSDYGFVRCHNSFLVNTSFVRSITKENGGGVLLENGTALPVSKQKKEMVKQALVGEKRNTG
ncbi:MAG TPA: LytTR family DNA-binding domain-containing protein, partial [Agriterribacter sp.]|nr:LytTR family DNA-binding domain-containing protein [Agriterribacter sp.]